MKTPVKKMSLRPFKLNRVYLDPLNMSNAGDFSWSWILKDFIQVEKEGREIRCRISTSSIKHQIRRCHVVVVQWTSKKCTKTHDARVELLFWSLNLLGFEVVVVSSSLLSSLLIFLSPEFRMQLGWQAGSSKPATNSSQKSYLYSIAERVAQSEGPYS